MFGDTQTASPNTEDTGPKTGSLTSVIGDPNNHSPKKEV